MLGGQLASGTGVCVTGRKLRCDDTYQWRITECDQQLQKHLASFANTVSPQSPEAEPRRKKKAKPIKNAHASISAANCSVSPE